MDDGDFGAQPPLARLLLFASRWFDAQTLAELERRGWPRLSPAQSLVFAHLTDDGLAPSELARRLGQTRQSTQDLVGGLVRLGMVEVADDPARRGGRFVRATPRGRALAVEAYGILLALESSLGARRVQTLRRLLADFDRAQPPPRAGSGRRG